MEKFDMYQNLLMISDAEIIYEIVFGEAPMKLFGQPEELKKEMLRLCVNTGKKIDELTLEEQKEFGLEGVYDE